MKNYRIDRTPLQKIVGFDVANEIYDKLPLTSQVILDLRMEGYTYEDIAEMLGLSYSTVYEHAMRSRHHLAKLKMVLEVRQYYKEEHPIVLGEES